MDDMFKTIPVRKFSYKRVLWLILIIPLSLYLGLGIYAWFFADRVIFQPQPSSYKDDSSIIKLTTPGGEKISAKYFPAADAKFTILYSHGNAADIGQYDEQSHKLNEAGFSVFEYDYRGYGTSEGSPSEKKAYEDAEAAYNYLVNELKIPADKIIIHGHSLGGGLAIDLAARKPCAGLIAEATFVTAFRVLTVYPIYPFDEFKNIDKIKNVKCPVLIIHGKQDGVIAFWHGEKLFAAANEPKSFLWIENAGHNDIFYAHQTEYIQAIQNFSAKLSQ